MYCGAIVLGRARSAHQCAGSRVPVEAATHAGEAEVLDSSYTVGREPEHWLDESVVCF